MYNAYCKVAKSVKWIFDWIDSSLLGFLLFLTIGGMIIGAIPIVNYIVHILALVLIFIWMNGCVEYDETVIGTRDNDTFMTKYKRAFGTMLLGIVFWASQIIWAVWFFCYMSDIPLHYSFLPIGIVVGIVAIGYVINVCRLFHKRMKWESRQ